MKIPYFMNGEQVMLEGTLEEILKHIEEYRREDATLVMKNCHVEGETLCLD